MSNGHFRDVRDAPEEREIPAVEIVTGVNLPMLIKLSGLREGDLLEVARVLREQGKGAIYVASEILEKETKAPPKGSP